MTKNVAAFLINTSKGIGFSAELKLEMEAVELFLNPSHGWRYVEMQEIFFQILKHKDYQMKGKEKYTLRMMEKKIQEA